MKQTQGGRSEGGIWDKPPQVHYAAIRHNQALVRGEVHPDCAFREDLLRDQPDDLSVRPKGRWRHDDLSVDQLGSEAFTGIEREKLLQQELRRLLVQLETPPSNYLLQPIANDD